MFGDLFIPKMKTLRLITGLGVGVRNRGWDGGRGVMNSSLKKQKTFNETSWGGRMIHWIYLKPFFYVA